MKSIIRQSFIKGEEVQCGCEHAVMCYNCKTGCACCYGGIECQNGNHKIENVNERYCPKCSYVIKVDGNYNRTWCKKCYLESE